MPFQPRRAIVTASDSGIGRATTAALGGAGMDILLGRPGGAREIAAVVAFLASAQASCAAGTSWPVNGEMLQMGPQAKSHGAADDWRAG
jgi:NAD(P)-dependent dehydrogenase (short-subunit alcohol dehydrogenase family)